MKRFATPVLMLLSGLLMVSMLGCTGDPNIEGARLDLRNRDYDRALQNVDQALERNPENAQAHLLKGQILQEMTAQRRPADEHFDLIQRMKQSYTRAAELEPARLGEVEERLRIAFYSEYERGAEAFNRGDDEQDAFLDAYHHFRGASIIMPDSTLPYVYQAYAMINAGRPADAIASFEAALETEGVEADSYVFLSELYLMENRLTDVVNLLESAYQRFPDDADIQAQLLNAYIRADMIDRAREVYGEAVVREPDNKIYRYNYGSLLLQAERYDEAIPHLRRATEIDPEYGHAWFNLGVAFVNQAVAINERLVTLEDELRDRRATISAGERQEIEAEIQRLDERRLSLFAQSIEPLENARQYADVEGQDLQLICQTLFSAYYQTGQEQRAQEVAACAGYTDLN
jgi:tetratricopeptide (TPR) repeat protein